jgi:hypothetical protein
MSSPRVASNVHLDVDLRPVEFRRIAVNLQEIMKEIRLLVWVALFGVAFAFVESSVVVYLRAIYYPEGFAMPLKPFGGPHLGVELAREAATIVMLAAVGALAGRSRWGRFAYFMIAFGFWDIFYYVWLKVTLDWPASVLDWDILFLLPVPWLGPVLAPVVISLMMIASAIMILRREEEGSPFAPTRLSRIAAIAGSCVLLYSFMLDLNATTRMQPPMPYRYDLFGVGIALMLTATYLAFRSGARPGSAQK